MPIYAYKCSACGFAKDALQKMADLPLAICPQCGADAFRKQLTAAGFQLKGSGWYVTDFKGGNQGKTEPKKEADGANGAESEKGTDGAPPAADKPAADGGKSASPEASAPKTAEANKPAPAAPAPAPPSPPRKD